MITEAITKIDEEIKTMKNTYAEMVGNHIKENYLTTEGNAEKYLDKEKSLEKCLEFVKEEAKAMTEKNIAVIEQGMVYGWAAEYYNFDNTAADSVNVNLLDFLS